jgi:hypothetical protein
LSIFLTNFWHNLGTILLPLVAPVTLHIPAKVWVMVHLSGALKQGRA